MNLRRMLTMAAALALFASTALAQGTSLGWSGKLPVVAGSNNPAALKVQVVGGVNPVDTSGVPFQFNSDGTLKAREGSPASSFVVFEPDFMNTILTARLAGGLPPSPAFLQDSTDAKDVRGANGLALMAFPTFDDSVSAVALALQFRWHYSATVDSQSTYIEMASRRFPMTSVATVGVSSPVSAAVRDSIGSLLWIPATSTGLSRYSVGAAAVANTDSLATPDEEVLVLTNVSGVNRGRMLRITPPRGPSGSAAGPYLSVRVRYLNGYNASGVAWGNGVSGFEPQMRLRLSLVGWR